MNGKKGFLLIECCLYVAICAILTLTIMRWITQTVAEAGRTVQSTDRAMMNILVHDVIVRDLHMAPSNPAAWLAIQPDQIVWKTDAGTMIGWSMQHAQLVRKEGHYNAQINQWGKHHTSTIAHGVTQFRVEIEKENDFIKGIKTTICLESSAPSVRYARLRNGRML